MSRRLTLPLALLLLALPPKLDAAAIGEADYARTAAALTDEVALPAVAAFATASADFARETAGLCTAADADPAAVQAGFLGLMEAWQRVQPLDFGPLRAGDGPARFEYWPDRRGIGARQLARVLKSEDPGVTSAESLAGKSVALGDLQALERLLFGDADGPSVLDPFRCAYARAIAELQAARAAALLAAWEGPDGQAAAMRDAVQGNELYYDAAEAVRDYLGALTHGLQTVAEAKLEPVLGHDTKTARPRAAESWRSGHSLANISANLATLEALVAAPEGLGDLAARAGDPLIGRTLRDMIEDARERLLALDGPLALLVRDTDAHAELTAIADQLERAHRLAEHTLAEALLLIAGFNASDGD